MCTHDATSIDVFCRKRTFENFLYDLSPRAPLKKSLETSCGQNEEAIEFSNSRSPSPEWDHGAESGSQ